MQVEPSTSTIDQISNQEQTQYLQDGTHHQENDQDPPNDNGGQDIGDSSPSTPLHLRVDRDQDERDDEDIPAIERPEDALVRIMTRKATRNHTKSIHQNNGIGGLARPVSTRVKLLNFCGIHSYVSHIEPVKVYVALEDEDWVQAMHEELRILRETKYGL